MSINGCMDKQNVCVCAHVCAQSLFRLKEEGNADIYCNIDELVGINISEIRVTRGEILCDSTHLR